MGGLGIEHVPSMFRSVNTSNFTMLDFWEDDTGTSHLTSTRVDMSLESDALTELTEDGGDGMKRSIASRLVDLMMQRSICLTAKNIFRSKLNVTDEPKGTLNNVLKLVLSGVPESKVATNTSVSGNILHYDS